MFKNANGVTDGGTIIFPLNRLTLSILDNLRNFCSHLIGQQTPNDLLNDWLNTAIKDDRFPANPSPLPYQKNSYQTIRVTPNRLKESIPNSSFTLEDLVYSIQQGHPFSEQIKLPLS